MKNSKENWFDFDVVVATPDMMGLVADLARILGTQRINAESKIRNRYF